MSKKISLKSLIISEIISNYIQTLSTWNRESLGFVLIVAFHWRYDTSTSDLRGERKRLPNAEATRHVHRSLLQHDAQMLARRPKSATDVRLALPLLQRLFHQHSAVLSKSGRTLIPPFLPLYLFCYLGILMRFDSFLFQLSKRLSLFM